MNDLTNLPPNSLQSRPTWSALSGALKAQLIDGRSDAIASSPVLLAECERSIAAIHEEATRGATPAEIAKVLSQRFALFPQPDRTEGEWDAWWADYNAALEGISPAAIEAGMAEYVRQPDSEFFPKPGKLRELAQTVPNRMARALQTAERALRWARQKADAKVLSADLPNAPSDAERAQVKSMLASFKREMAERNPKRERPALPPISGPVDEHGLTAAMRAHMASRPE